MKKRFMVMFAAILAAALLFAGCELTESSPQINNELENSLQTDAAKIAAAKAELAIPAETDRDLDLPAVLHGVAISWASSDEAVISDGGQVTRGFFDAAATLTATLALDGASDTKTFAVTVLAVVFEETEAELVELNWWEPWPYTTVKDNQIIMQYAGEDVVFNCTVDYGLFSVSLPHVAEQNASVHTGDILYWVPGGEGFASKTYGFIDIIVQSAETIIGYAVIEAYDKEDYYRNVKYVSQGAIVLKSVLFPVIDGEYQNVSEAYVKAAIEKIKAVAKITVVELEAELFMLGFQNASAMSSDARFIIMTYPDENVVFYCTVDKGTLSATGTSSSSLPHDNGVKNMSVLCYERIYWNFIERGDNGQLIVVNDAIVEIVLKIEEIIIGYAVIEVIKTGNMGKAYIKKSVLFPQIDGAYQNVSESYVKTAIKKAIDSVDDSWDHLF